MRTIALAATAVVVAGLAGTAYFALSGRGGDQFAQCRESTVAGGGDIGGPFTLTRQDGVEVTETDVIDGPTLIYFGFTYCPDVCPLDLTRNAEVTDLLDQRGVTIKPVMITIDPERDTPEVIGEYAEWLHPRMVGLTGTLDQIEVAKSAYRVYASKRGSGEDYVYDHMTLSYLMAPDHGFLGFFRNSLPPEQMADRIACFAEAI